MDLVWHYLYIICYLIVLINFSFMLTWVKKVVILSCLHNIASIFISIFYFTHSVRGPQWFPVVYRSKPIFLNLEFRSLHSVYSLVIWLGLLLFLLPFFPHFNSRCWFIVNGNFSVKLNELSMKDSVFLFFFQMY